MTSDDMVTRPSSEKELNLKGLIGSANGSRTRLLGYRTVTSRSKLLTRKGRYGRAVHAVSGSFAGMFARCLHGRPSLPLRRGLLRPYLRACRRGLVLPPRARRRPGHYATLLCGHFGKPGLRAAFAERNRRRVFSLCHQYYAKCSAKK